MTTTLTSTLTSHRRTSHFEQLAGWAYRHRWLAAAGWLVVLLGVTLAAQLSGSNYRNDYSLPGTESQRALDTLRAHASADAGAMVQVVFQDHAGLAGAPARVRVERLVRRLRTLPHVGAVRSPYDGEAISADGTIGYATVLLDKQSEHVPAAAVHRLIDTAQAAAGNGLRVELGGAAIVGVEDGGGGPAEGVGMLAALVVLVLLFGSLLAAAMPVVIAIFAVGSAIGFVALASHVSTVANYTPPLMVLVGLGVGIDYAMLLFARFRDELRTGAEHEQAARRALDSAGRTVLFAGSMVIVALTGLIALGLGSLQGVAVAVALTVLVTMAASLTLLPALLAIVGPRVEAAVRRRAQRHDDLGGQRWRRWSDLVQRRPWPMLCVTGALLVAMCLPAFGMRLGFADAGNGAESRTSRQAYDLLAEGFGPGFNGPLIVVASGHAPDGGALRQALSDTDGVAATTAPIVSADGTTAVVIAYPTTKPQAADTQELVARLRNQVLPPVEESTGASIYVGGPTAAAVDFADAVSARLPLFLAVVIGLSALLLFIVFRSVLIPLKAAMLNLLSVGVALGVLTLVFQHGLLGVAPGPIEAFVPVMIFAIAFGLSMDYEMFLLSRMHEEWRRYRDAATAVREGLAITGRVVTAAASIMVVVFASFLLDDSRMLRQFGLGLAVAVLVDALLIRCVMLPAIMHLFGARAWWLPAPIARRLPRLALEAEAVR
ncbi:MAG TPA: MMPL family transporter [Jatrophihabitans sp.]|nr:MMPL family transporter [Jatrophihabitans sp.]